MNREMKSIVIAVAIVGAAWWLLRKLPKGGIANAFETRTPEAAGLRTSGLSMQHVERSIDDVIEASFPASDPSAWTPVVGTGRLGRENSGK